ncbi:hypothetical protein DFP72DRAFT_1062992 [Ephemerocybe angulata]|uniref:Uncharacterized protein n=1 Tax=Ephemerocybe angulata TaxID=980116 RepID=A0A8H6M986_9AGAR|nr:hypothetical protein DFP72DRAFT_1062992 [Tulosesus angulatus]
MSSAKRDHIILSNGERPRNSLSQIGWLVVLVCTILTWCCAGASIGLAANAYVKWTRQTNELEDEALAMGVNVEVISPDLLPAGIALLALCCVIFVITTWILIHTLVPSHRPSTRKVAHRGFNGVPTFNWAAAPVLFVLAWLVFGDVLAYTHVLRTGAAVVRGYLPSGQYIDGTSSIQVSMTDFRYHKFKYLLLVAILPWFTFLMSLITSIALLFAADEAAQEPEILGDIEAGAPGPVDGAGVKPIEVVERGGSLEETGGQGSLQEGDLGHEIPPVENTEGLGDTTAPAVSEAGVTAEDTPTPLGGEATPVEAPVLGSGADNEVLNTGSTDAPAEEDAGLK